MRTSINLLGECTSLNVRLILMTWLIISICATFYRSRSKEWNWGGLCDHLIRLDARFVVETESCNSKIELQIIGGKCFAYPPRSQMKNHLPFYIILWLIILYDNWLKQIILRMLAWLYSLLPYRPNSTWTYSYPKLRWFPAYEGREEKRG